MPYRHIGALLLLAALLSECSGGSPDPQPRIPDFYERSIPPLGECTVVPISGEPFGRKLLAASLQGIVNRTEARLYLVDGDPDASRAGEIAGEAESQRHWLAHYVAEHGLVVEAEASLDEALDRFAAEASGYVLASQEEPWTVGAATTLAGLHGGLVASADEAPRLESADLPLIDDLRGRWGSAAECIRDTFETLYSEANPGALAIVYPLEYRLRDFLIQNRIFVFYGRPNGDPDAWQAVRQVLEGTPPDQPVFGYLATDGLEEYLGVQAISAAGKFLNPSDNIANLSFHSAVVAQQPPSPTMENLDCAPGTLRVAIAISDGDNLSIPLYRYLTDRYWPSSERGSFPLGWSLSPALVDLAPAIAAYYGAGRTEREEMVGLLGIGYAHPTEFPDPAFFLQASFTALRRMGMTSLWFIDPNLDPADAGSPVWEEISRGHSEWGLAGLLVGYVNFSGSTVPDPFWTASGMPVVFGANAYSDRPEDIEDRLRDALEAWRAGGPDAVFISASVWMNDVEGLARVVDNLAEENDLTFLTPSELLACLGVGP